MNLAGFGEGIKIHKSKARIRLDIGESENGRKLADRGLFGDLVNNLRASAIGWANPISVTLFGPFRICA